MMATDSVPDATPSNEQQQQEQKKKTPVVMLVVGMAGSGKTTFMQRIASQLYSRSMAKRAVELERILAQARAASAAAGAAGEPESTTSTSTSTEQQAPTSQDDSATASTSSAAAAASSNKNADADADAAAKTAAYIINLDPAVLHVPFPTNIDIRDTVNYKEVMKQYRLGPNGAIMTSLNLFSTQFHQVVNLIESKAQDLDYVLVDTPGQIEVFNWSASGSIILGSLASAFPTVMCYVVDTPRCASPSTFMSNMLYACSILYKSRLPLILVFNKTDSLRHEFAIEWMTNFDAFQDAVSHENSYMSGLTRSMSLVLDEFYRNLRSVGVSSMTGQGVDDFFDAVDQAKIEYQQEYRVYYEKRMQEKHENEEADKQENLTRLERDLADEQHER